MLKLKRPSAPPPPLPKTPPPIIPPPSQTQFRYFEESPSTKFLLNTKQNPVTSTPHLSVNMKSNYLNERDRTINFINNTKNNLKQKVLTSSRVKQNQLTSQRKKNLRPIGFDVNILQLKQR